MVFYEEVVGPTGRSMSHHDMDHLKFMNNDLDSCMHELKFLQIAKVVDLCPN
jgi:hypothetical protein